MSQRIDSCASHLAPLSLKEHRSFSVNKKRQQDFSRNQENGLRVAGLTLLGSLHANSPLCLHVAASVVVQILFLELPQKLIGFFN